MQKAKQILLFLLWLLFFVTFTSEFIKIVFELSPATGHKSLGMANAFFWSSLFMIELVMGAVVLYYIITYPSRRIRLISLSACHFTVILLLPVILDDWSWTCLLYPWPHSLQAFDPDTPQAALLISVIIGFAVVPFITWRWGAKAFCGYLCPHGAFFSETYGRVFTPRYRPSALIKKHLPRVYFIVMTVALVAILLMPDSVVPIRSVQKLVYFFTAEFFFFVVAVPLLGGRSYCTLICPLGYAVRLLVRTKRTLGKQLN